MSPTSQTALSPEFGYGSSSGGSETQSLPATPLQLDSAPGVPLPALCAPQLRHLLAGHGPLRSRATWLCRNLVAHLPAHPCPFLHSTATHPPLADSGNSRQPSEQDVAELEAMPYLAAMLTSTPSPSGTASPAGSTGSPRFSVQRELAPVLGTNPLLIPSQDVVAKFAAAFPFLTQEVGEAITCATAAACCEHAAIGWAPHAPGFLCLTVLAAVT